METHSLHVESACSTNCLEADVIHCRYGDRLLRLEELTLVALSDLIADWRSKKGTPFDPYPGLHDVTVSIISSLVSILRTRQKDNDLELCHLEGWFLNCALDPVLRSWCGFPSSRRTGNLLHRRSARRTSFWMSSWSTDFSLVALDRSVGQRDWGWVRGSERLGTGQWVRETGDGSEGQLTRV